MPACLSSYGSYGSALSPFPVPMVVGFGFRTEVRGSNVRVAARAVRLIGFLEFVCAALLFISSCKPL
jgi:hypothetical protein